jgi:hypothetical protein
VHTARAARYAALAAASALVPGCLPTCRRPLTGYWANPLLAHGELHGPYAYRSVAGRMVYVPAMLAEAVRVRLEDSSRLGRALEEISAINLELLARRELD